MTLALSLFATVLTGGRRFAHVERLREDEVVKRFIGAARLPSAMTLTRYFGGFVRSQVEQLSAVLAEHTRVRLARLPGDVLDLDSTVFERYGRQQGRLKGHNPSKHGRPSHHPLLAMLARSKLVLHSWLRSGNSGSARGVSGFLAEALARLPEGFAVEGLRADSGFFVRERIAERPDAKGRRLFDLPGYTFHTVVTTLDLPAIEVWRFYNGRSDCENRLKELKHDYGADGFCLNTFEGTEAVFRLICAFYNLLAAFKAEVTRDPAPQLARLRTEHLALLERIDASTRSTVMQSRNALEPLAFTASRPWQPRPARRSSAPRAPLI